jgi:hypothetical protein
MPFFDYQCPRCQHVTTRYNERGNRSRCELCGQPATRIFAFSVKHGVPEHFNNTLGTYVNNEQDVRDGLKRAEETQFDATGFAPSYEYLSPADMSEASAHGVTEEGMDVTRARIHEEMKH